MLNTASRFPTDPLLQAAVTSKREFSDANLRSQNARRINFSFSPGRFIYVKNISPSKTSARYEGPFRILQVGPDKNVAQVQLPSHREWFNFRRIKPLKEEEDVV